MSKPEGKVRSKCGENEVKAKKHNTKVGERKVNTSKHEIKEGGTSEVKFLKKANTRSALKQCKVKVENHKVKMANVRSRSSNAGSVKVRN